MQIDVCQTNGYGNGAAGQHQFLKDQLQRDLSTIISKYTRFIYYCIMVFRIFTTIIISTLPK